MPPESDLIKLYSGKILQMAAEPIFRERLSKPDASATKRSPLCGSAVTVDINVESGFITHYGQDVRACALGQASSTIVGKSIVGRSITEVRKAYEELSEMLKNNGPTPSEPFDDLYMLQPASEYKNRHASILLTIEATLAAFQKIEDIK
tara:strand:- start:103 stop:549 length:447 start_codon:yes stop_codon:yes gene_type:complete